MMTLGQRLAQQRALEGHRGGMMALREARATRRHTGQEERALLLCQEAAPGGGPWPRWARRDGLVEQRERAGGVLSHGPSWTVEENTLPAGTSFALFWRGARTADGAMTRQHQGDPLCAEWPQVADAVREARAGFAPGREGIESQEGGASLGHSWLSMYY